MLNWLAVGFNSYKMGDVRNVQAVARTKSQCSSVVEQRFRKPSVAGSIPAIGSISNCVCSKKLEQLASATDTKTDTKFGVRCEFRVTGDSSPVAR